MAEDAAESNLEFDPDFTEDERLFHYTSSKGFFGILDSGCLWATHFKFLNDSNEFVAARKSLTEFVEHEVRAKIAALKINGAISLVEGQTVRSVSEHEAKVIVDAFYSTTLKLADPFVFSSFVSTPGEKSFRNGELLHWATYGRSGGYALEINPHKLAKLIHSQKTISLLSRRAVYADDAVPPELKKDYDEVGKMAQAMVSCLLNNTLDSLNVAQAAWPFMRIASVIKDGYFKSEKEARLVAIRYKKTVEGNSPPAIHVRHSEGGAVPYIKLFEDILFGENCPVEAIIIGPHPQREKRRDVVSLALEARGLTSIDVIQSEVPYLGG